MSLKFRETETFLIQASYSHALTVKLVESSLSLCQKALKSKATARKHQQVNRGSARKTKFLKYSKLHPYSL